MKLENTNPLQLQQSYLEMQANTVKYLQAWYEMWIDCSIKAMNYQQSLTDFYGIYFPTLRNQKDVK